MRSGCVEAWVGSVHLNMPKNVWLSSCKTFKTRIPAYEASTHLLIIEMQTMC